jgi:aminopeptidase N
MVRSLLSSLALLGVVPGNSGDNYPKNPDIDIEHYAFALELSDDSDEIGGVATITARFRTDGVTLLRLDLANSGQDSAGRGMAVEAVMAGATPLSYTHESDVLLVRLPPSVAGARQTITVRYGGVPAAGLTIGPNKHGDRTFFSDNWPDKARHWLPTVDHPYDKASAEMIVTAPSHYQVISNGLLVETSDLSDGRRLTHWRQSVPIASWLYVLGVARFAVQHVDDYQGAPIQTWVYPQDRDAGFYDFAVPTKDAMAFYGDRVGPFAYEKLANIQSNSVGGGMEAATAIFYGDDAVTGTRDVRWRNVIIHEVAHQWFGNAVTESDWDDVWLSEGFATYFTLLFIEHAYGRDAFVDGLERSRQRILTFYRERPDYRVVHDHLTDMGQVTTGMQYQKGAWTLHMLRGLLGTELFWEGIRTYYRRYLNGNASTADFRRVMEEVSGQDLAWFFQQWLYQGGIPTVEGTWRYDAVGGNIIVDLHQTTPTYRFRLPIDLAVRRDGAAPTITRVVLEEESQRFVIASDDPPASVELDPEFLVLMDGTFTAR